MATNDIAKLRYVWFSELTRWGIGEKNVFCEGRSDFPLVPLKRVLRRVKTPIVIENERYYKRITVRQYGNGVCQRDEIQGMSIGTKHQFVAHAGQFIVSRIDARNGSFGIVPKELDKSVVTNDFLLFEVDNALPEYLLLTLSSRYFQRYWQNQSSGTTNRQRISENEFLQTEIMLPTINTQRTIVRKYYAAAKRAETAGKKADECFEEFGNRIIKALRVVCNSARTNGCLTYVPFQSLSRWDIQYLTGRVVLNSKYQLVPLAKVIKNFLVDGKGKSLRKSLRRTAKPMYRYIGMEQVEKDIGECAPRNVVSNSIHGQVIAVPTGYVLYGKLRPYLNKYWENTSSFDNIVCSPEFFVFDTVNIDRRYFLAILSSTVIQCQLPPLYRGARMPRITEDDFLHLLIPLPPKEVQHVIADSYMRTLKKVSSLRSNSEAQYNLARQEFEAQVFANVLC